MTLRRALAAGLRIRSGGETEPVRIPNKVNVSEWAAEHPDEVEGERQARALLRRGLLEILGVEESQLADGSIARKLILSSAVTGEDGEPFPDIQITASISHAGFAVYDRIDPSTPAGWELGPLREAPNETAHPSECLNPALGTEIRNRRGGFYSFSTYDASLAADRLSDVLELVRGNPAVYDAEAASTVILPPQR